MNTIQLPGIGRLAHEKTLVRFDIDLLWIAKDPSENRYAVLCEDDESCEYLIVPVDSKRIIDMLAGGIPMRELFTNPSSAYWAQWGSVDKQWTVKVIGVQSLTDELLPQSNAYFEHEDADLLTYRNHLQEEFLLLNISWILLGERSYKPKKPYEVPQISHSIHSIISHSASMDTMYKVIA